MASDESFERFWATASFTSKMDWAAREVSKFGLGTPKVFLAYHWFRSILQNVVFLLLVWLFPPSQTNQREYVWSCLVRYTAWTHALESSGLRNGPIFGRFGPGLLGVFSNAYYRLTPGTLKLSLFPPRYVRRGTLDSLGHAVFFLAVGWLALVPYAPLPVRVAAAVMSTWVSLFDHQQWIAGHGPTYSYILVAGCLPATSGCVACVQLHVILVWIGCGLGKVGPWFQFVNGPFMTSSLLLQGRQWFWRLAVRGEKDLRPTPAMASISTFAAHVEWAAPLLLFFTGTPTLVHLGVVTLVAMHGYINFAPAVADVYAWNFWFMASAVLLFGGSPTLSVGLGFDWAELAFAPKCLLLWVALESIYLCYGLLYPARSPYNANHRHWAGNWPNGMVLIRKEAAGKLLQGCRVPGPPQWEGPPAWLQSWMSRQGVKAQELKELRVFKKLGDFWNVSMNMKLMPALVEGFLAGRSTDEFHILHILTFADLFVGGPNWNHRIPELVLAVGKDSDVQPGDCVCIWTGAFPFRCGFHSGCHPWQIIDAKAGLLHKGEVSIERALSVSSLPSAGQLGESLLANSRLDQ